MAAAQPVKVLFSGAPRGNAAAMVKKVEAVNKKVGAAALFTVGPFFGEGDATADPDDWLVSVVTGEVQLPIAIYCIGGYGAGSRDILEALPASDAKLKYLGRAGVTQVAGLTVAFLDGSYNAAVFHSADGGASTAAQPGGGRYFTQGDVLRLKQALLDLQGEVDVLFTCEWPRSVTRGLPSDGVPQGVVQTAAQHGSKVIDEIADLARPRYHIVGGQDVHWARLPYANRDLGVGQRATRFISLADVDGPSKGKALHALALVPSSDMDPDALSAIPDGATASPFDAPAQRGTKRAAEDQVLSDGQDWRWSMRGRGRGRGERGGGGGRGRDAGGPPGGPRDPPAVITGRTDILRDPFCIVTARNVPFRAAESDIIHFFSQAGKVVDVVRGATADGKLHSWLTVQFDTKAAAERALSLSGADLMGRPVSVEPVTASGRKPAGPLGQAVEGCWFCLGSASVDLSLVASVGEEAYLALDKGAITDHHVLVVSIDHYPSTASMPPSTYAEIEKYLSALRAFFAASGKELVAFERYLALRKSGGNHCHINAIAVPSAAAKQAGEAFQKAAQAAGFSLTLLPKSDISADTSLSQAALKAAVGETEYFLATLPDGSRLLRPIMRDERWPMNLGRDVLAQLVGQPERAEWKACAVGPEEQEARTERFKAQFKAYDVA